MKTLMRYKNNDPRAMDFSKHPFEVECYELRTGYADCNRVYYEVTLRDSQKKFYVECGHLPIEATVAKNTRVGYRVVGKSHWNAQMPLNETWSVIKRSARVECEFHDVTAVLATVSSFIRTKQRDYYGGPINPQYRLQLQ